MNLPEEILNEIERLSHRIAKLLGLKQGSCEIHCHKGEAKEVHVHDKSIKFKGSKSGTS